MQIFDERNQWIGTVVPQEDSGFVFEAAEGGRTTILTGMQIGELRLALAG